MSATSRDAGRPGESAPTTHFFRDTVVIGTSAGGLAALRVLLAQLPAAFSGSVFIVQHQAPSSPGTLAAAIQTATALPVICTTM